MEAVIESLHAMGFADVQSMDSLSPGMKREDLQIHLPVGDDEWVCLVEVKGESQGAKTSWFGQILRHVEMYSKEHGPPEGRWLIINTERKKPPGQRRRPYTNNNADDAAEFGRVAVW